MGTIFAARARAFRSVGTRARGYPRLSMVKSAITVYKVVWDTNSPGFQATQNTCMHNGQLKDRFRGEIKRVA